MVVFLRNVIPPYLWGFLATSEKKFEGVKVEKYDEETEFFGKKMFSFKKASLLKLEGAK